MDENDTEGDFDHLLSNNSLKNEKNNDTMMTGIPRRIGRPYASNIYETSASSNKNYFGQA